MPTSDTSILRRIPRESERYVAPMPESPRSFFLGEGPFGPVIGAPVVPAAIF